MVPILCGASGEGLSDQGTSGQRPEGSGSVSGSDIGRMRISNRRNSECKSPKAQRGLLGVRMGRGAMGDILRTSE